MLLIGRSRSRAFIHSVEKVILRRVYYYLYLHLGSVIGRIESLISVLQDIARRGETRVISFSRRRESRRIFARVQERCTASWKYHWTIRGAYQAGVDDVGVTPRQTLFLVFSRYVNKKTREFLVRTYYRGGWFFPAGERSGDCLESNCSDTRVSPTHHHHHHHPVVTHPSRGTYTRRILSALHTGRLLVGTNYQFNRSLTD